jgi:MFS family permease
MLSSGIPAGREVRRFLLGTLFSSLGLGLALRFLLVYLTQVRGLNAGTVGVLVAATAVVGLAVTPVGGWLVGRVGARRVVLPSLLMVAGGALSLAFVDSAVTALAALISIGGLGVAGLGGEATPPLLMIATCRIAGRDRRSPQWPRYPALGRPGRGSASGAAAAPVRSPPDFP